VNGADTVLDVIQWFKDGLGKTGPTPTVSTQNAAIASAMALFERSEGAAQLSCFPLPLDEATTLYRDLHNTTDQTILVGEDPVIELAVVVSFFGPPTYFTATDTTCAKVPVQTIRLVP
jgi:hypothetical protein